MAIDRLVGADATLSKASFGSTLTSGTATAGAWYKIIAKDGDTVFPAGYIAGDLWQGNGTATFSATNSAQLTTFTTVADCSSFSFDFSSDSIETTVLADEVKKYRKGKTDLTGTISGINFISEMKKSGSLLNRFLRIVNGDSLSTVDSVLSEVDAADYYIQALLQDDTGTGQIETFLFGKVDMLGYNLGAEIGSAQEWSSEVRFTDNDPIVYFIQH